MARFVADSQINLSVNARQAKQILDQLTKKAEDLRKRIDAASRIGDANTVRRLTQELRQTEAIMRQMTTETANTERVLRNLDRASPRELQKTLARLTRELNNIQRGSEQWNRQTELIRRVRAQIDDLNASLRQSESFWQRFNRRINDYQTSVMGAVAAVTGIVMAGRKAINSFTDMEQEMANVQKFTGMAKDEVVELNESLKTIDTRASRETLNRLAQDAGRLGKTSQEEVLGFVRASQKVNVALDDLGEGATLTLSKLTSIFGEEERLGTERALLSVGSVINELSQNCSASAPYIAQFASRMGGVAAQAGMTAQQVMAFAAVLDTTNQGVEAASTAVSQVITRLYQDTAKYARVAGLDVKKFSDLLKKDANQAFILFLETLNKAGGMDVLSPMFAEMGETGARAIAALSSLANNISMVKEQQRVANEAFREATSIDKEFDVQNNTVKAGMEKARKTITELSISLGEKLMPVMRHVYSSTSLIIHALDVSVSWLINNRKQLLVAVTALTAYAIAAKAAAIQTGAVSLAAKAQAAAMHLAKVATLANATVTATLTGNLGRARAAWRLLNTTMLASPIGLITAGLTAVAAAVVILTRKTEEYNDSAKKTIEATKEVSENTIREQRELDILIGKIHGAREGTDEHREAKQKLINQYGKYLSGLIDEGGEVINLAKAYDILTESIARSNRERSLDRARQKLQDDFYEFTGNDLTQLQKSLESYGHSVWSASAIVTQVSQAVATGKPVPEQVKLLIEQASKNLPTTAADGREYSNYAQRVVAKAGLSFVALDKPTEILARLERAAADLEKNTKTVDSMQLGVNPSKNYTDSQLQETLGKLTEVIESDGGTVNLPNLYAPAFKPRKGEAKMTAAGLTPVIPYRIQKQKRVSRHDGFTNINLTKEQAKEIRDKIIHELNLRGKPLEKEDEQNPESSLSPSGSGAGGGSESGKKKDIPDEFKKLLAAIKAERDMTDAKSVAMYATGDIDFLQYNRRKYDAEMKYYNDSLKLYEEWKLTEEQGYASLTLKKEEAERDWNQRRIAIRKDAIRRIAAMEEKEERDRYNVKERKTLSDELALQKSLLDITVKALYDEQALYEKGSKEYEDLRIKIEDVIADDVYDRRRKLARKVAEMQNKYEAMSAEDRFRIDKAAIDELYAQKVITEEQHQQWIKKLREDSDKGMPGAAKQQPADEARKIFEKNKKKLDDSHDAGIIDDEEYAARLARITAEMNNSIISGLADVKSEWVSVLTVMYQSWQNFADALKDPDGSPFEALTSAIAATAAVMGAVMQEVTALTEAEVEIQTRKIESRYNREIGFAEGNAYLTKKLEKEKEKELAKMKADAAKKTFAMQVAATVAQAAANAVQAYGAGLSIGGMAGLILAPIAAALALAQGAVQIAVLKKQQQISASAAGYMEGGFTRKGRRDEPAGIVHAGEWVASQALVNSPKTRPLIDMLEYAQRNNRIGSLSMEDVSRSLTAPMAAAYRTQQPAAEPKVIVMPQESDSKTMDKVSKALDRLYERLEKPITATTHLTGPGGINEARDEYNRIIKNKSR